MSSHAQQARTLVEALPYIQKFTGKTIVVKYGGNAMISDALRKAVMCDIILLSLVGIRVVVVHGGGPEISEMLKKIGHESRFVDGLRYTDAETMDVVQSVLCGKVNKNLVAQLNRLGGQAIGLCGMDGQLFQAERLDEKYGLVGRITQVNPEPVENALPELADGNYTCNVTLEGGSGRSGLENPTALRVENGEILAVLVWNSPNYDYMKVGDTQYFPVNEGGNSTFEIPVTAFDAPVTVIADTVAMSTPHEITYTLTFDSASVAETAA